MIDVNSIRTIRTRKTNFHTGVSIITGFAGINGNAFIDGNSLAIPCCCIAAGIPDLCTVGTIRKVIKYAGCVVCYKVIAVVVQIITWSD